MKDATDGDAGRAARIAVVVVDDHSVVREGLEKLFEGTDDLSFASAFSDGNELLRALPTISCDVIVLDLSLPSRGGIELLKTLRAQRPELAVVVFSAWPEGAFAQRMLRAGASAFVSKSSPVDLLLDAIRAARGRERPRPPRARRDERLSHERLSPRELQVFTLLVRGKSPTEIATDLRLSLSTVSTHIAHVREKLAVSSVADMVRYALREGLLE